MSGSTRLPTFTPDVSGEYATARSAAVLFDRSDAGKISVTGSEAVVFLHNLCTNHIKALAAWHGCEAFFCAATAKVIGHGYIWREADAGKQQRLWVDLPSGLVDKMLKHLDRYLISEDVELLDRSAELAQFHLAGPRAGEILQAMGLQQGESAPLSWSSHGAIVVRHIDRLGLPGCDLLCPAEQAGQLAQRLVEAGARPSCPEVYETLRVEAAMPLYGSDIDETTFAPEVGRTEAISYNKGCYLGQEPIVMARDRGVVQRGLVTLVLGETPAPMGSKVWQAEREVGRTLSSLHSPQLGRAIALAYVRRNVLAPGTRLEVALPQGRVPAEVARLPLGQ
jgi:folate-binding protein YgfZ